LDDTFFYFNSSGWIEYSEGGGRGLLPEREVARA